MDRDLDRQERETWDRVVANPVPHDHPGVARSTHARRSPRQAPRNARLVDGDREAGRLVEFLANALHQFG